MSVDVYRWRLLWKEVFTCGEEARELPMPGTASPSLAAPLSTESNLSALTPSGQLPTIPLPHLFFPLLWLPGLGMLGTSAPPCCACTPAITSRLHPPSLIAPS
ncbi:unnamed protein product [Rangifer tarandus platyrhynchus]|uniref:Uncharacterized protein n=2 Tax=Rangifer tarandus platyrhynchus TaxID=3082113 RepID=A0AC59YYS7_RANTA|nr:unnamed protein product [Rangifer tarandus platyrhynchus]